jgi:hypothetical protein
MPKGISGMSDESTRKRAAIMAQIEAKREIVNSIEELGNKATSAEVRKSIETANEIARLMRQRDAIV